MKLSTRIMAALVLGVVAGLLLGADGAEFAKTWIAPFGAIFMNMIKMTIVPMVFASLVMGMCSLGDIKKIRRIGMKTVIYYLVTTAFAIVLGLILGSVIEPGAGMNLPAEGLVASAKDAPPLMQVIVNIFPTNPIESMLKADMLQIIVFALFLGLGISMVGEPADTFKNTINRHYYGLCPHWRIRPDYPGSCFQRPGRAAAAVKSYRCRLPWLLFARCICIWRHAESYRQIQPA